jgi:hypothetical protein
LINKLDGTHLIKQSINGTNVSSIESLLFKYPATLNEVYLSYDSVKVKVISINENVTVPAGTFSCYHYQTNENGYLSDNYISPGVGMIKQNNLKLQTNDIEKLELISYTIK